MADKQVRLDGKLSSEEDCDDETMDVLKSALQKSVRRGRAEQAMYFALKLCERNWYMAWRRICIIAVEDCGQVEAILSVGELYRMFMAMRRGNNKSKIKELTWDEKRCFVAAAKILSESTKDRRADEFLELMDVLEKRAGKDKELAAKLEELCKIEDYVLDMHTRSGRMLHRGNLHWYEISSETENRSVEYDKWHSWFKPLLIRIEKEKRKERGLE